MAKPFVNSGGPDQMLHYVAFLHSLPHTLFGVPRLNWVKIILRFS